jgi:predicted dehydrogenase
MAEKLNVGIIGLGYIGKTHAQAYRSIPFCFSTPAVTANLSAVWRTSLGRDEAFIHHCGFDSQTTDLGSFFRSPLDLVDICTPTAMHTDYVKAAAEHGKAIYCEKPLGKDFEDAKWIQELADKAGVMTRVAFVMRFYPAVRQMKSILDSGELGEVLNFRGHLFHGSYLNPLRPMSWRLRFKEGGGGAFSDLGAHILDLVLYLMGDVARVRADMRTFIKERPTKSGSDQIEKVDVDDWTTCTLEMANGAFGLVEAARTAVGIPDDTSFQVFCRHGSMSFSSKSPDALMVYDNRKGELIQSAFKDIPRDDEREISKISPSGKYSLGYFMNAHLACQYDFLQNILEGKPSSPDFSDALKVQEVLEAAYISAADGGRQVVLPFD